MATKNSPTLDGKIGDEKGNNIQDQDPRYPPYRLSRFGGRGKVPGHKWGILGGHRGYLVSLSPPGAAEPKGTW